MILGVAIKRDGKVYKLEKPARHCDIIKHVVRNLGLEKPIRVKEQGFYSDKKDFLNRVDARQHAIACDQLITTKVYNGLFSEDVW